MTECCIPEIPVSAEKPRGFKALENGKNVLVGNAAFSEVLTDLTDCNAPFTQPPDFDFGDVFVEDEHAA